MKLTVVLVSLLLGALLGSVGLSATGCTMGCTLAGCGSSTSLTVLDASGAPLTSFHGVARTSDGVEHPFGCPASAGSSQVGVYCSGERVDLDLRGKIESVTIESDVAAESAEVDLRPYVQTYYPNGEECGPTCYSAGELEITLTARP